MRAVQLVEWQQDPQVREVPIPRPGPGQVLIKVAGAGVCHSDLHVIDWPAGTLPYRLPFTLGHETAGWVEERGPGVEWPPVGEPVLVYGPWGCGVCHRCAQGAENYCLRAEEFPYAGGGLGIDGGMAEYMLIPSPRLLVPLGQLGLDPRTAAPLTDAALTPYHAIKRSLRRLMPGSAAVVIGVGGLGHTAVQLLRALSPATVIAVDIAPDKLQLAQRAGAHHTLSTAEDVIGGVRDLTRGQGASLVVDCVGSDDTMATAAAIAGSESDISLVGLAGGTLPVRFGSLPWSTTVTMPYWGTRGELFEVAELAAVGKIEIHVEMFPLDEALEVYQRLRDGLITGRAVLLPS